MDLTLECRHCGGTIRPRITKLAVSAVGHALVAATAAMNPSELLRARISAAKSSQLAGSMLVCHGCGRDASFGDLVR